MAHFVNLDILSIFILKLSLFDAAEKLGTKCVILFAQRCRKNKVWARQNSGNLPKNSDYKAKFFFINIPLHSFLQKSSKNL
jgi:hypothetical protein